MRFPRQLLSALLGALTLVALLLTAGPASAHDAAESSSPADGATVATAPAKVSITFNNTPLGLGSQVKVTDAAGTDWADGKVEIVDNVASQNLREGAPAGKYSVVWRVVSSDSHPIEGTFSFTATAAAAGATAVPVPTVGTPQPGATQATGAAPDSSEPFPWSIVVFAAVALGLLITLGVLARRRLGVSDEPDGDGN
ncbi:copper resistance CopC family protein [Arthrobacter globiformis]|uniref:Copper resistance protein CopC n=1 Tax=Arthrobacter globiformis TaxID=1665 RepID=A0A328HDR3_ARTGO|nr:copper resistance CopC family protein [Arthrobacter globiformis]RAM36304.1 copper resistance protein CopC [Arthrobacter globiformis]